MWLSLENVRKLFIRHKLVLIGTTFVILVLLVATTLWLRWRSADFQTYGPVALPAGTHIASKQLIIWSGEITHPELVLHLSKADVDINEDKGTTQQATRGTCIFKALNETCQTLMTPNHQKYFTDLVVSTGDETVSFTKGSTFIWVYFSKFQLAEYEGMNWGEFIDSFHPVSFEGIRIIRAHAGG
jgi:hypothetical protein